MIQTAVVKKLWKESEDNEEPALKLETYFKEQPMANYRDVIDIVRKTIFVPSSKVSYMTLINALYWSDIFQERATYSERRELGDLARGLNSKECDADVSIVPSQPFIFGDSVERISLSDGGRIYRVKTPDIERTFEWRGVTSINGTVHPFDKTNWIKSLQRKNPEWEMDQILQFMEDAKINGAKRGTATHLAVEKYVADRASFDIEKDCEKIGIPYFKCLLPYLRYHVDQVIATEPLVWWDMKEIAGEGAGAIGYIDLLSIHNGKIILNDWKTSDKPKRKEFITGYLTQVAAYSAMVYQMYGIKVDEARIVVAIKGSRFPQIFTMDRYEIKRYLGIFIENVRTYQKMMEEFNNA